MIFNVNNIYLFNDGKWKNLVLQFLTMQNVFQTLTKLVLWCILFVISLAYFFLNIVLLLLSVIVPLGITQARKVGQLITTSTSKILRNCERFILIVDFLTAYFIFVNMGVKLQTLILSLAISEWIIKKAVNLNILILSIFTIDPGCQPLHLHHVYFFLMKASLLIRITFLQIFIHYLVGFRPSKQSLY